MSGTKAGAKTLMGICMATGFVAGFFTYSLAIPVEFFALITLILAIIAVIVSGSGFSRGEDNGGLLGAGGGMAILGAGWLLLGLYSFQVVLIPFIILEIGAILFLCY